MGDIMADIKDIISNIENIYGSNNSLSLLKDFERVIDELDVYVYENWLDGELVEGPKETRYYVQCTFMWPNDKMPEPKGGKRLLDYGCRVQFGQDYCETGEARRYSDKSMNLFIGISLVIFCSLFLIALLYANKRELLDLLNQIKTYFFLKIK